MSNITQAARTNHGFYVLLPYLHSVIAFLSVKYWYIFMNNRSPPESNNKQKVACGNRELPHTSSYRKGACLFRSSPTTNIPILKAELLCQKHQFSTANHSLCLHTVCLYVKQLSNMIRTKDSSQTFCHYHNLVAKIPTLLWLFNTKLKIISLTNFLKDSWVYYFFLLLLFLHKTLCIFWIQRSSWYVSNVINVIARWVWDPDTTLGQVVQPWMVRSYKQ